MGVCYDEDSPRCYYKHSPPWVSADIREERKGERGDRVIGGKGDRGKG